MSETAPEILHSHVRDAGAAGRKRFRYPQATRVLNKARINLTQARIISYNEAVTAMLRQGSIHCQKNK